jgi:hypothetical protein
LPAGGLEAGKERVDCALGPRIRALFARERAGEQRADQELHRRVQVGVSADLTALARGLDKLTAVRPGGGDEFAGVALELPRGPVIAMSAGRAGYHGRMDVGTRRQR